MSRRQIPVAIAVIYGISGALWIIFSDRAWGRLTGFTPEVLQRFQTYKGLGYVFLTSLLIWWLVRRALVAVAAADAARSESQSRYRRVFETTSTVCLLVDAASLSLIDVNLAAAQFYGWSRQELIGKPLAEIDPQADAALRETQAADPDRRSPLLARHQLRGGAVRDVELHTTLLMIAGRQVLFSMVHDITDRVRAERQLAESEANFRRALELASDAIVVSDREGTVLEANARTEELLGCDRGGIIGRPFQEFAAADNGGPRALHLRELVEGQAALSEWRLHRRDGSQVQVEISARDLGDGRLQAIIRDISERRRLEEQLRRAQKLEAIGQLTGGIAHDLNNLLTVVLANSELLAAGLPAGRDDLRADLGEMQGAARRGAQMIQKLLGFSSHAPLTYLVLDLDRVTWGLLGTLRRLLPAHIEVEVTRPPQSVKVRADSSALEQILINLVTNARDAMPGGGRLELGVRRVDVAEPPEGIAPGPYACLTVRDNGTGMDERVKEHLFEPFFTTKAPGEGRGLGLAMIYGLVQQHGGFIEFDSEPGTGTEVRVLLPLAHDDQPVAESPPLPAPGRGHQELILLVDDEEGLRRVAQRALERIGYRVLTAADGQEALELIRNGKGEVDLIVTDVVMPRLGGVALYRTLREDGVKVRFLFTSGYSAPDIEGSDLPDGEFALLQKPWTFADLAARVREVLDRRGKDMPA